MNEFWNTNEIFMEPEDVNNNKVFGILSYFSLLFLVPLFAAKESRFAKFHANQGLVAFLTQLILTAVSSAVCALLGVMHLGFLASILGPLVSLVCLVFSVTGIVFAAQGKAKELPLIGKFHILDSENQQKNQQENQQENLEKGDS